MNGAANEDDLLRETLRDASLDTIYGVFAHGGGQDIVKAGLAHRRRTRLCIADSAGRQHVLYLKRYEREGLSLRLRRLWTFGRRQSPAGAEFRSIEAARRGGVPTMRAISFGEQFGMLGAIRSYIIVTAVPGEALSRCGEDFLARHGVDGAARTLAVKLGALAAALHRAGLVHRDFYSTHVFLHESGNDLELYLIDLGRVFSPRWRAARWRVKDLAQLKFSMPEQWFRDNWPALLEEYFSRMGAGSLPAREAFTRAIDRKADAITRRHLRRQRSMGVPPMCITGISPVCSIPVRAAEDAEQQKNHGRDGRGTHGQDAHATGSEAPK